jgi:hypothetical protein
MGIQGSQLVMSYAKREHNYGYLNFFEIERSGLYRVQRKSSGEEIISKNYGLGTMEVFRELTKWVKGRAFKETAPWPSKGGDGGDPVMCYCREIKEFSSGDFLVVLWKHDPTDTRGFRGLELGVDGKPTGNYITNGASSTGENYVWGHPCYYWVIPDKDMVVSIKFDDSKCDSELMQKWVNYCVRQRLKFPGYNSRQPGDLETRISFSTPENPETYNLLYRFSTSIKVFKTSEEHLERICETTKYMLLRNEVVVSDAAKDFEMEASISGKDGLDKANIDIFNFFQSFMAKFFPKTEEESDSVRKVEIKLEATPTVAQMKELMSYSSSFGENDWADVIFIDENEKPTSIKSHRIVERIVLPPAIDAYSCDQIYKVISEERSKFAPLANAPKSEVVNPELSVGTA